MRSALLCLLLVGCGTQQMERTTIAGQENLLALCPNLQPLTAGDGATITRWITKTTSQYQICQARHEGLVEATRKQNEKR